MIELARTVHRYHPLDALVLLIAELHDQRDLLKARLHEDRA